MRNEKRGKEDKEKRGKHIEKASGNKGKWKTHTEREREEDKKQ